MNAQAKVAASASFQDNAPTSDHTYYPATTGLAQTDLEYEVTRVKSPVLGRDLNPMGRGDGSYYANGGNFAPDGCLAVRAAKAVLVGHVASGFGNSVNNSCAGPGPPHCFEMALMMGRCDADAPAGDAGSCCNPDNPEVWKSIWGGNKAYRDCIGTSLQPPWSVPPDDHPCRWIGLLWLNDCFCCGLGGGGDDGPRPCAYSAGGNGPIGPPGGGGSPCIDDRFHSDCCDESGFLKPEYRGILAALLRMCIVVLTGGCKDSMKPSIRECISAWCLRGNRRCGRFNAQIICLPSTTKICKSGMIQAQTGNRSCYASVCPNITDYELLHELIHTSWCNEGRNEVMRCLRERGYYGDRKEAASYACEACCYGNWVLPTQYTDVAGYKYCCSVGR